MKVLVGEARGGPLLSSAVVLGSLGLLIVTVWGNFALQTTTPIIGAVVTAVVAYRVILSWQSLAAWG